MCVTIALRSSWLECAREIGFSARVFSQDFRIRGQQAAALDLLERPWPIVALTALASRRPRNKALRSFRHRRPPRRAAIIAAGRGIIVQKPPDYRFLTAQRHCNSLTSGANQRSVHTNLRAGALFAGGCKKRRSPEVADRKSWQPVAVGGQHPSVCTHPFIRSGPPCPWSRLCRAVP
jgi:hypothetical protein